MTNREKVLELVRKDNKKTTEDVIEFCQNNDIDYVYFENINDLFDYYDEDLYQSFTNNIIDVIFASGELLKILN